MVEFSNPRGTVAFRVSGTLGAQRIRENFKTIEEAEARAHALEIQALNANGAVRVQATRLTDEQLADAECALVELNGRPERSPRYHAKPAG